MQATVNKTRLKKVKKLCGGLGEDVEKGICIMQAVDYVSTGGLTDHPECACPALTRFAIRLNDKVGDELRKKMLPLVPKLVGTRDGKTKERAEFIVHRQLTVAFPIFVRALGLEAEAEEMSKFAPGQFVELKQFCNNLKPNLVVAARKHCAAYAAADAADAAYAAAYAAYAAYAYAAYAYADAYAYAAYAAADAADAAYAAAYAAYADGIGDKKRWDKVRKDIHLSSIKTLELACKIKEKKRKVA
jgi:hypothetical protein